MWLDLGFINGADMNRTTPQSLVWLSLALGLQALLLTHTVLLFNYGISLRGDGLELLLLITTLVISVLVLFRGAFQRPRWFQGLYILNCIGFVPLVLSAMVMGLGIYATDPIDTFVAPSGTQIALKNHAGLLGCSVDPYLVEGVIERSIYRKDNHIYCFNSHSAPSSFTIEAAQWSPDETQLTVTVNRGGENNDYTFEVGPAQATPQSTP